MMGVRQALPPTNLGKYYREAREQQIKVGRYRVGSGAAESYKDANWQLRHFYEPTMTW
jgi:GH25 family lysozyme M1 (1,4-beta-N-acetylmuramidase)